MKIAILIKNYNIDNYENIKFRQKAHKQNIRVKLFNTDEFTIYQDANETTMWYQNKIIEKYDAVLPRLGCSISNQEMMIINAFKAKGCRIINDANVIELMANKQLLSQELIEHQIPVIPTMVINGSDLNLVKQKFTYPLIFKSNTGSLGKGVYLVNSEAELDNMVSHSQMLDKSYSFIVQKFIDHRIGEDVRVMMFNQEVLGIMQRKSTNGDFKANFSVHGQAQAIELPEGVIAMCQQVMTIIGATIAGIDLIETADGYVVCEVNSAPGFKGMEAANPKLDIATKIFKQIKTH